MPFDVTTEEIWHFIGSFQQLTEAARGRAMYDAYRAQKAMHETGELKLQEVPFAAPHKLLDFQPGVRIGFGGDEGSPPVGGSAPAFRALDAPALPLPSPYSGPVPVFVGQTLAAGGVPVGFDFELPPPASVAVILAQSNVLSDQDIQIQHDFGTSFSPFSAFDAPMAALWAKAHMLDQMGEHDHPADIAAIKALGAEVAEDATLIVAGESGVVISGPDVAGLYVNGAVADAAPVLADHLPDLPEPVSVPPGSSWEDQVEADASANAAHVAILGGNTLTNEVVLTVSWLDAPVMLVAGDAMTVSVISQINVLSEDYLGASGTASESEMINLALCGASARAVPDVAPEDEGIFPNAWIVTTLNADLIVVDWITQQNFVLDHDMLSLTWSGASSFLLLGDNTLINFVDLLEIGQGYDLIVIGGDMINISVIRQMNVLLDADWIATGGGPVTVSAGGNMLWNSAQMIGSGQDSLVAMDQAHSDLADAVATGSTGMMPLEATDAAFEGVAVLNVLYITGDYLTLAMIDQINILGDADQVAALATEATYAEGAEVTVITGSNALINLATINTLGFDSEIQVSGDLYSDAVIYQANLIDDCAEDSYAAQDPTALASEAVLFLAEGMLGEDETGGAHCVPDSAFNGGQADGVNAVLA